MKKLLLILLFVPFLMFSQSEKRIALVIGNANYDSGELKNPVNDALLVSSTLQSLKFEVILDTNITDRNSFITTIREFVEKRMEYDVALVYYVGHGVQIDNQNFLLPTKEKFKSEQDVQQKAVNAQHIMRYICGDSIYYNSLISFSTLSGHTGEDGDGENSLYCKSLCKNIMIKDISLDQIFRNVRNEMSIETNGLQVSNEINFLVDTYYFSKSISDKINIFILDAARDNPFEGNWNQTR